MALSRKQIQERINVILKRQTRFERLVNSLQNSFFEEVLANYDFMLQSPTKYAQFFARFTTDYHLQVLQELASDLRFIVESNKEHFTAETAGTKDTEKIIKEVENSLLVEYGVTPAGGVSSEGYLADIIKDTAVKRNFRQGLLKFGLGDTKLSKKDKALLEQFIKGDGSNYGIFESFYAKADKSGSRIFDVYQKADRLAQNEFATGLKMQAAIYVGGTMTSSREFCVERNGKIFLRSEIESWETLKFKGKPETDYVPAIDLGGYNCRHHLSWISNATALRLDPTLREDASGNLYRIAA